MASRKRSRHTDDVDGEVEVEVEVDVESASSSLRATLHKRSRVALAAENGGSVVSDDDEDEVDGDGNQNGHGEDGSDLSEMGDDGSEVDELLATQIVEKQIRKLRDNIASEQGVIEEVFCRNFMCHSKLRIKLGPLINFIIGHNGSGKSAVLTALTMCLGGSAKVTNRGASLKSLIKEGEESATLAVKIKNRGDAAYKQDLYGRSITVERHFTRAGTSGFKLKNAEDKVISTKKADLDDILDFFAFQLDNPINVLTQDMARQFLSNSSPADKYKFFIRGTQLETLDHDYKIIEEHFDNITAKLQNRIGDIKILEAKAKDAEARKMNIDQIDVINGRIKKLQGQHAWAQVGEQEVALEGYERRVQEAEQRIADDEREAETYSGTYTGHDQATEAAERNVTQLKEQQQPIEDEHTSNNEKFGANTTELSRVRADQRNIKTDMQKMRKNIQEYEAKVREESDRIAGAEGSEHAERLDRLEEMKRAAEAAKRKQTEHSPLFDGLDAKRNEAFTAYEAVKPELAQHMDELQRAQTSLSSLQRNQGRPFDGYKQNMDQLVRAVERETRWRQKPVGPMGKHCRLLKPQWSSQIEKIFGSNLDAFVVTNGEDQRVLSDMMKRVNCSVTIFIGDPTPLDNIHEPDGDVDTVLRVLNIDNDLVRNQAIINQSVEQICLIEDGNRASDYLYGQPGQPHVRPRNVKAAIAFADNRRAGIRYEFSRSGDPKSSYSDQWRGPARMQTDRVEQIRVQEESMRQAQIDLDQVARRVREKQLALTQANQELKRHENTAQSLKREAQRADDAVEEQTNTIESMRPQDGKLQELEKQLVEEKENHEATGASYEDAVNSVDSYNKTAQELKRKVDELQRKVNDAKRRVETAENQVLTARRARDTALREKNEALEKIDHDKSILTQLQEKHAAQKQRVEEFCVAATSISRRVPVEPGLTAPMLDKRIEKLEMDAREKERDAGGSREDLTMAWRKAQQEWRDAQGQIVHMKKFLEKLGKSLAYRQYRWERFRNYIAYRARFTFSYLLSERNFRGRVLLDHDEKYLDIAVEPDLSKTSDAGREAKTLSGGEKSFSTICLLLSIWEAMGSPIRCLDEFDVFMDSVNRSTSMTMMIKAARRSVGRQFILITPQAMNNVEMGDDVRVHRMSDPERGQGVLPFTQT